MSRTLHYGRPLESGSIQRRGPWYDPNCPRCEFGWIDTPPTNGPGRDSTIRCYDCQARAESMKVPAQRGGDR